jgi:hypothetical protein
MFLPQRSRIVLLVTFALLLGGLSTLIQSQEYTFSRNQQAHGRVTNPNPQPRPAQPYSGQRGIDFITDGSLEVGTYANPFWEQDSTKFGYVICNVEDCVAEGNPTVGPRTGNNWAWFGGAFSEEPYGNETGTLWQPLKVTAPGTVTLEFYLWVGEFASGGDDTFKVEIGDSEIFSASETDTAYHSGYTLVSIDISEFADGVERTLKFTGTDIGGTNTNWSMDDIVVLLDGSTATPTETPIATATETPLPGQELLDNGGFEQKDGDNPQLAPWTVKNVSGDKIKCNKDKDGDGIPDKIVAHTGDCAFRFKGMPGENAKLRQEPDLTGFTFSAGDTLNMTLWADAPGIPSTRAKVKITYSDGTDKGKLKVDIGSTSDYDKFVGSFDLESGAVSGIRISIDNKTFSGKLYIDAVSLKIDQDVVATSTPDSATNTPAPVTNTPQVTETPGGATDAPTTTPDGSTATNTPDSATNTPDAATETPTDGPSATPDTSTATNTPAGLVPLP